MGAASMLDEEEKATAGLSKEEIVAFAKSWMGNYFAKKPYYCGGEIPAHLLFAKKRVNLVLDCTFDMAIDIIDAALDKESDKELTAVEDEFIAAGGVSEDIKTLINVLQDLSRDKVPQELSNGMIVLYFEFCLGVDVVYA